MITLTERDRFIIIALLFRVPVLWLLTLSRLWPDNVSGWENMLRRLEQLQSEGLLERHTALTQAGPVERFYFWLPGMPAPDFGALAWALSKRWEQLEPQRVTFFTATEAAGRHFGRTVRNPLKSASALAHNLGLGSVFVELGTRDPVLAEAWVSEEIVACTRGHGEKVVDACLLDSAATPVMAIEFAGASYAASNGERLREIHEDCLARSLGYEMWTISRLEERNDQPNA